MRDAWRWSHKPPLGSRLVRDHPMVARALGYWIFNEQGASRIVNHVDGRQGAPVAAPVWAPGPRGVVPVLNGSSQYFTTQDIDTPYISILARVRADGSSGSGGGFVVNKNFNGSSVPFSLNTRFDGTSQFGGFAYYDGSWRQTNVTTNIEGTGWRDVAGTFDGVNLRYYLDGALNASTTVSATTLPLTNNNVVDIGRYANNSLFFLGAIEYVLIVGTAWTREQIVAFQAAPYAAFAPPVWRRYFVVSAGGGDERTVAGDMPASSATLARTLGALRSVAGNQPASTGALARVYQAVRALTGDTPAPSGALAYLRGYFRALAGDMPAITGTLARVYQAVRAAAGSLPAQSGTLTRTAGAFARTQAGDLPSASGVLEYAFGLITRSLEGAMPASTGAVSRTYQALRTLTGAVPAASGVLARTAGAFARGLLGDLPAASGVLTRILSAARTLAGDMPSATAGISALTVFLRSLAGELPAATGAVTRTAGAFVRSVVGDQPSASGALARTAGAFARALLGALGALSGAVSALGGLVTDTRASVTLAETQRHTVTLTVAERSTCTLSEEAAA